MIHSYFSDRLGIPSKETKHDEAVSSIPNKFFFSLFFFFFFFSVSTEPENGRMCSTTQTSPHPPHLYQTTHSDSHTLRKRLVNHDFIVSSVSRAERKSCLLNLRERFRYSTSPRPWKCRFSTSLSSRLAFGWRAGAGQEAPTQQSMTPPLHWFQAFAPLSLGKV